MIKKVIKIIRNIIGFPFITIGYLLWIIVGLWGLTIEIQIINYVAGFWGVVIGFVFLPIMLTVTPFYALAVWGNWFPLLIIYGGSIFAWIIIGIGYFISKSEDYNE